MPAGASGASQCTQFTAWKQQISTSRTVIPTLQVKCSHVTGQMFPRYGYMVPTLRARCPPGVPFPLPSWCILVPTGAKVQLNLAKIQLNLAKVQLNLAKV